MSRTLTALPLTTERFAAFGDVLETSKSTKQAMNSARFERYNDLAKLDFGPEASGHPSISIARGRTPTSMPYRLDMLERHPDGSQAFMPLSNFSFVVVVAPAEEAVNAEEIAAFITNGRQGINYHKGVWHMPMIATQEGQEFLIVDRAASAEGGANCDEQYLSDPILIEL
jgi:ureidoglycolate lyase